MHHDLYMQRCHELAQGGEGLVAPNPLVGAVLIHNQKVIAEGYHHKFGAPHAEVEALKNVHDPALLRGSTLYVNLEPCSHFGKTPPCANLIIEKGIKRVVISNIDPNPLVRGKGIALLKSSGIEVVSGVLENQGAELNRRFFTFHKYKRPYIILKWAQTSNGFISPAGQQNGITWISNQTSQLLVHKWRGEEQAILVGRTTVSMDNPQLTTRHFNRNNPIRIVIDPSLKLTGSYNIFNNKATTWIFNTIKNETNENVKLIKLKKGNAFLTELLKYLFTENIQSLIVEGGAMTLTNFIKQNLWDEARVFRGSSFFADGTKAPVLNSNAVQLLDSDGDQLAVFRNIHSSQL